MDVRQAEVAADVAVGEKLVVQADGMQDRGLQVMEVDLVDDRFISVLVGRAPGHAGVPPTFPPRPIAAQLPPD